MVPDDPVKFKLAYRASKHGFGMKKFHEKCDGVDPTLIIIHSSEGRVFGGYTDIEWQSKGGGKTGNKTSFIFSLRPEEDNKLVRLNHLANVEVYHDDTLTFGVQTFEIKDDCQEGENCRSNLSYGSYEFPEGVVKRTEAAKCYLAGAHRFDVTEIEVFQCL